MTARLKLQRTMGALMLLVVGVMLANRGRVLLGATYASLMPMAICAFRLLFSDSERRFFAASPRLVMGRALLCAGLTLLFLAMLSYFELHNSRMFSRTHLVNNVYRDAPLLGNFYFVFHRFVYLPAVCGGVWYLLYDILSYCADAKAAPAALPSEADRRRLLVRCWLCIAIGTVFGVMCVYPSYNVSDVFLIKEFAGRPEWNAWHTMGYLFFVRLVSLGGRNFFLVVIAQGCVWAYANFTALRLLSGQANCRRACIAYTAASLLSFLPYLYCSIMYKDTLFMSCMLGLCVSLTEALTQARPRASTYARLALFGLGVSLFRLGTFPIVLIAFLLLLLRARKSGRAALRRAAAAVAALVCLYVCIDQVLPYKALSATKSPDYVMYTLPMNMIGAVAASGAPIAEDELAVMEQILPYEKWARAYNPYFMDPLSRTDEVIGKNVEKIDELHLGPALLRLNARFLLRYPRTYLTAFFNANSIVWEMGRPDDGRAAEWNWMLDFARAPMQEGETGVATQTFGFTTMVLSVADFSYDNALYHCLVWRGGCSLFVLILCAAALLVMRRSALLIAMLPPFGFSAMLMLSIPSQDPRYVLPALVTAVFFCAYVFVAAERPPSPDAEAARVDAGVAATL